MSIKILIPSALRQYAQNRDNVELSGKNAGELLENLTREFPDLKKHLYGEDGKVRNFVNIYVNDDDIRYLQSYETEVNDGDIISIIPSVAGGAETVNGKFSKAEIERYSRHLIMPEVAMEGQRKLKRASVLLVGMGGLGSPTAMYLAAAGVGRIGIVDFDVVDVTNLQRQIIYSTEDVGRPKLQAAEERLKGINPYLQIDTFEKRLTSENALEILGNYDIIIDGTDNFPTRYLVNDACVLLGKPNVYGSIFRFEGQASVFYAKEGPCYRCLYPEPPPPGLVPSCAEGGVLGILPGNIGMIQATEAVKLILGKGEPLIGRLLLFDALAMKYRELKLRKDPNCPICGENPTVTELIDYEHFCGIGTEADKIVLEPEFEISVEELKAKITGEDTPYILDVREPHEFEICRIPNSVLIPLAEVEKRVHELDRSSEIVVHCKSGGRSAKAVKFLKEAGFEKVKNLKGGILAWADEVDPSVPKY
ncbi:molybdopterin-synthase adenylyltransferase MoeB [candidate division KSB1 bacterium]|nr:molybdopterin-synthase adenylyltransferase MoeB [candidate division KSB1 bacterium]